MDEAIMKRRPYRGEAAVAIDGDEPWSLDRLVSTKDGRWSQGEPTIYLGGDPGVALAEFSRHLPTDRGSPIGSLWGLQLDVIDVADLRELEDDVVLDPRGCRALARRLRGKDVPGLVVPSVAFLDDRGRGNIVLFAEVLGASVSDVIRNPRLVAKVVPERSDR